MISINSTALIRWVCLSLFLSLSTVTFSQKPYKEFSLELEGSERYFFKEGRYVGQERNYLSAAITPEFFVEWADGNQTLNFKGFARLDQHDNRRTHWDIRELYWQGVKENSELSIGLKKIYWGKTESAHLVDIINQTDVVESFDGEQKLGEMMVHFSQFTKLGTFDLFALPYYRKVVFPGIKGRLRFGSDTIPVPLAFDSRDIDFQDDDLEEFRPSFAGRYSHYIGKVDFAISHFYGVGREPIIADLSAFDPIYGIINQTGVEVQVTTGPVLWKLESIVRRNKFQDMFALATGFEYTFGNVGGSGVDIGLLGEYLYDDRGNNAFSGLQSDIFTGLRLGFNDTQDTQFLAGGIFDYKRTTKLYFVEAQRRIGNNYSANLEARFFTDVDASEFAFFIRDDSFIDFTLSRFF